MHLAAVHLNIELIFEIINNGEDINKIDAIGNNVMHYAINSKARPTGVDEETFKEQKMIFISKIVSLGAKINPEDIPKYYMI